jgi:hypothetical protein
MPLIKYFLSLLNFGISTAADHPNDAIFGTASLTAAFL